VAALPAFWPRHIAQPPRSSTGCWVPAPVQYLPTLEDFFFFLSVPVHVADKPGAEFSQKNQNSPAEATLAGSRKAAVGEAAVSRRDVEPLMQQAGARYVWAYVLGKE